MEQTQKFILELDLKEIQVIGSALMEIPTKAGMPLLQKLEKQVTGQIVRPEETANTADTVSEYEPTISEDAA